MMGQSGGGREGVPGRVRAVEVVIVKEEREEGGRFVGFTFGPRLRPHLSVGTRTRPSAFWFPAQKRSSAFNFQSASRGRAPAPTAAEPLDQHGLCPGLTLNLESSIANVAMNNFAHRLCLTFISCTMGAEGWARSYSPP